MIRLENKFLDALQAFVNTMWNRYEISKFFLERAALTGVGFFLLVTAINTALITYGDSVQFVCLLALSFLGLAMTAARVKKSFKEEDMYLLVHSIPERNKMADFLFRILILVLLLLSLFVLRISEYSLALTFAFLLLSRYLSACKPSEVSL